MDLALHCNSQQIQGKKIHDKPLCTSRTFASGKETIDYLSENELVSFHIDTLCQSSQKLGIYTNSVIDFYFLYNMQNPIQYLIFNFSLPFKIQKLHCVDAIYATCF